MLKIENMYVMVPNECVHLPTPHFYGLFLRDKENMLNHSPHVYGHNDTRASALLSLSQIQTFTP